MDPDRNPLLEEREKVLYPLLLHDNTETRKGFPAGV
jgi:hypothetical protein